MPTPLSEIAIVTPLFSLSTRTVTGSPLLASRVLDEVTHGLLERARVDLRFDTGIAQQADLAVAALGGDRRNQDGPQRLRLDPLHPRRRMRRQPREQLVHLADRRLQGRDHVGPELRIVRVPLRVARQQR